MFSSHGLIPHPTITLDGESLFKHHPEIKQLVVPLKEVCYCHTCHVFQTTASGHRAVTDLICQVCEASAIDPDPNSEHTRVRTNKRICPNGCTNCPSCITVPLDVVALGSNSVARRDSGDDLSRNEIRSRYAFSCSACNWKGLKLDAPSADVLKKRAMMEFPDPRLGKRRDQLTYDKMIKVHSCRLVDPETIPRLQRRRSTYWNQKHREGDSDLDPYDIWDEMSHCGEDWGVNAHNGKFLYYYRLSDTSESKDLGKKIETLATPFKNLSERAAIHRPPYENVTRRRQLVPLPSTLIPLRNIRCATCDTYLLHETWEEGAVVVKAGIDPPFPTITGIRVLTQDGHETVLADLVPRQSGWIVLSIDNPSDHDVLRFELGTHPQLQRSDGSMRMAMEQDTMMQDCYREHEPYMQLANLFFTESKHHLADRVIGNSNGFFSGLTGEIQLNKKTDRGNQKQIPTDYPFSTEESVLVSSETAVPMTTVNAEVQSIELALKIAIPTSADGPLMVPILLKCQEALLFHIIMIER